jgi:hypothetical protein
MLHTFYAADNTAALFSVFPSSLQAFSAFGWLVGKPEGYPEMGLWELCAGRHPVPIENSVCSVNALERPCSNVTSLV